MPIRVSVLTASKDLKPYVGRLRSITKSVEASVKKLLPIRSVDIVFYDNPDGTIHEVGGIGGFTPAANTVFISLNPRHQRFNKALEKELPYILAHELHHAIRFRTPIEKETLLEAMISEGLADHFALEATRRKQPIAWCVALSSTQQKKMRSRASKEWNEAPYDHAAWFYGSKQKDIPRWTGYAIGYALVDEYIRAHRGSKASKLVAAEASTFT